MAKRRTTSSTTTRPVSTDTTPPTVSVTVPANGAQYYGPINLQISASANDIGLGVNYVNIYITPPGGSRTLLQSVYYSAVPNTVRTANANYALFNTLGNYTITAEAKDAANNVATQSIIITRTDITTSTTTTRSPVTLPSSKILVTPTAGNQGGEGACAAFAAALVRNVEQYYTTGATSYSPSVNMFSEEYLYDKTKFGSSCGSGSTYTGNYQILLTEGVCKQATLPYSTFAQPGCQETLFNSQSLCLSTYPSTSGCWDAINNYCSCACCSPCIITTAMNTEAANYKVKSYSTVLLSDFSTVKRMICNNHAVGIGIVLSDGFINGPNDPNFVLNFANAGAQQATHGIAIIGYDDAKNAWLIQNSWGIDWGWNGKLWIDYNYMVSPLGAEAGNGYVQTLRTDLNYYPIL